MTKIKICGLSRIEDIEYANACMPEYIGFVFAPSKRRIDADTAQRLKYRLDDGIRAAGVFVDEAAERVIALCRAGIIDMIQLHGREDAAYIRTLRENVDNIIIKAVGVGSSLVLPEAVPDYFLFDNMRGGSGETFGWRALEGFDRPYFLAGGLHEGNVGRAIAALRPYCVDVSSGVETDGKKDFAKMRNMIGIVRNGDKI